MHNDKITHSQNEPDLVIDTKVEKIEIGQEASIASGPLKGTMVKVCSLPSRKRIDVLLTFLGSLKKVNVSQKNLIF